MQKLRGGAEAQIFIRSVVVVGLWDCGLIGLWDVGVMGLWDGGLLSCSGVGMVGWWGGGLVGGGVRGWGTVG
jgi:hypothetical protein